MSMLSEQVAELRAKALSLRERAREIGESYRMAQGLVDVAQTMEQAADTIESLRDKFVLQNEKGILYGREQIETLEAKWKANNSSRWSELFGTPERAARTLAGITCDDGGCEGCTLYGANCSYDENAMLGWLKDELRGDAE